MTERNDLTNEIGVIGMSGRFPGSRTLDQFWRRLREGVESISFFTDEELLASGVKPEDLTDPRYVKAGASLDDVARFDADFFGFSPREAEITDPQHRLFLECAWESLEDAGYNPETHQGRIGVYAGVSVSAYLLANLLPNKGVFRSSSDFQILTGNEKDYLSTRVSYKLNLRGPSITVQTACSSSLVAVHLACESLLRGECDMALAGGVKILVPQKSGYFFQEGGIWSPDGHCRPFDANGRGTIFGSGVGVVVLKRLSDALDDGDCLHAVIKGSAVNNDGSMKVGFTAPSVEGQAAVIKEALEIAEVEPESIAYIEAHGTGTPLGDPIEIAALTRAFQRCASMRGSCAIGSVKSNIGHLEVAAGIAGLIKTILALKHKQIPPSLHFREANPEIDFDRTPFYVNTALAEWKRGKAPRRAGVSSFGIGGTNAHVILEEAPPTAESSASRPGRLLLLSARTGAALEDATANLRAYLERNPQVNLADVSYTLQKGRKQFNHRRVAICRGLTEALETLAGRNSKNLLTRVQEQTKRPVVFMFSGQGSQYVNMAAGIYRTEPFFREQIDRCSSRLLPHLGFDLREILFPGREPESERSEKLSQTIVAQPALLIVEYALAQQWMAWGVRPESMIGHSIGEYVAACLAGVFTLEDAIAVVAARGRIIQNLPRGGMLAVQMTERQAQPLLGAGVSLAAINGPSQSVLSGPVEAIEQLAQHLRDQGVGCRRLQTSHAFHSEMMEAAVEPFLEVLRKVPLKPPRAPYLSNLTGKWITAAEAVDPKYWAIHLRQTVRFAEGLDELMRKPDRIYLEVGPGQALSRIARKQLPAGDARAVFSSLRQAEEDLDDHEFLLNTIGNLWLEGTQFDWDSFYSAERRHRIFLPTYPFERRRYWIEPAPDEEGRSPRREPAGEKTKIEEWFQIPVWKPSLRPVDSHLEILAGDKRSWIIFCDDSGLGDSLAGRLEQFDQRVIRVAAGNRFSQISNADFVIDPQQSEHYQNLIDKLSASGSFPHMILHLWSVTKGAQTAASCLTAGFYSLFFLAQAIGKQAIAAPVQIVAISNQMQKVGGEESLVPEKAALLGPCKVIPQEYPRIKCRSVDIAFPLAQSRLEEGLIDQLLVEVLSESSDSLVVYRGVERWIQSFESIRLPLPDANFSLLRQNGVYLITGGLGGIGLALAEELARDANAKLILTGRAIFPDKSEWEKWLATHSAQDALSAKIRKLKALEEIGASILIGRADVTDREQMKTVIDRARSEFGEINGVIHAAGAPGGGLIQQRSQEQAWDVLAPKVQGARALEELFDGAKLDFMAFCSSTIAITGGPGQVDYCAANAFLDSFAEYYRRRRGGIAFSINWDAWKGVGMAASRPLGPADRRPASVENQIAHPLFASYRQETPARHVYVAELAASTYWVLDEHRILGKPAAPGSMYLEFAAAAFQNLFPEKTFELRDVLFLAPLALEEGERKEVHTILEKNNETYSFSVVSRSGLNDAGAAAFIEHAVGKVKALETPPPRAVAIEEVMAGFEEVALPGRPGSDAGPSQAVVQAGPRWKSVKTLLRGTNEALAFLELPDAFVGDLERHDLHPALFDVATSFAIQFIGSGSYVPISYERIVGANPLPKAIYSHACWKDESGLQKESLTIDIDLYDSNGNELLRVSGFNLKRVTASDFDPDKAATRNSISVRGRARTSDTNGDENYISPEEGQEVFRKLLIKNILPQIVVTRRNLHSLIERANDFGRSRILLDLESGPALNPSHRRPDLGTPYVAPRTELEKLFAGIWQDMLGFEQIGVNDNFFELGGDSILAIQALAKINKAGFEFTPNQLFQYQTIAEIASLAAGAVVPAEEDERVDLTPSKFSLARLDQSELAGVLTSLNKSEG